MTNVEPREVLMYLNELGYTNISAKQLKEFVKDLKKLIKYELKQADLEHEKQEARQPNNLHIENLQLLENYGLDKFTTLYKTSTAASRAKTVAKKESVISVQIKRPVKESQVSLKCVEEVKPNSPVEFSHVCRSASLSDVNVKSNSVAIDKPRPKSCGGSSKQTKSSKDIPLKPKSSFIRPRQQVKACKSDPVALYHRYQEEWKRIKIPGVDNRSNLRWAIRERMLGEPNVLDALWKFTIRP